MFKNRFERYENKKEEAFTTTAAPSQTAASAGIWVGLIICIIIALYIGYIVSKYKKCDPPIDSNDVSKTFDYLWWTKINCA